MVNFSIRLPEDLHQAMTLSAERNRRSINNEILRAIEYYLKNAPEAHYDPNPPAPKETPKIKKTKP